jgi:hypothetical protein
MNRENSYIRTADPAFSSKTRAYDSFVIHGHEVSKRTTGLLSFKC